jgi:hypothetical protein
MVWCGSYRRTDFLGRPYDAEGEGHSMLDYGGIQVDPTRFNHSHANGHYSTRLFGSLMANLATQEIQGGKGQPLYMQLAQQVNAIS